MQARTTLAAGALTAVSAPIGWLTGGQPSSQTGSAKGFPREEA